MEIPLEAIAFIGIFFGILARTIFPYLQKYDKNRDDPNFGFEVRYLLSAIISAAIASVLTFELFIIPEGSMFSVFIAAFVFAWGSNSIINNLVK